MTRKSLVKLILPFILIGLFLVTASQPAAAEPSLFEKSRAQAFAMLGEVPKPLPGFRMGAVLITLSNPYWVSMKEGYENAARQFGITLDI
ncbi:MAG: hypothetical protein HUK40_02925 [Desulfobacter sp.]|nr:hypothetical protein [Desulfobacter sp.]